MVTTKNHNRSPERRVPDSNRIRIAILSILADGSAFSSEQLAKKVAKALALPKDVWKFCHEGSKTPLFDSRFSSARSKLVKHGMISSPERGCYAITEQGMAELEKAKALVEANPSKHKEVHQSGNRHTPKPDFDHYDSDVNAPRSSFTNVFGNLPSVLITIALLLGFAVFAAPKSTSAVRSFVQAPSSDNMSLLSALSKSAPMKLFNVEDFRENVAPVELSVASDENNLNGEEITVLVTRIDGDSPGDDRNYAARVGESFEIELEPGTYSYSLESPIERDLKVYTSEPVEFFYAGLAPCVLGIDVNLDEGATAQREAEHAAQVAEQQRLEEEKAARLRAEEEERLRVEAEQEAERKDPTVYITDTGDKYHHVGCRHLKNSSHAIKRSEAEAMGYTPCKHCYN